MMVNIRVHHCDLLGVSIHRITCPPIRVSRPIAEYCCAFPSGGMGVEEGAGCQGVGWIDQQFRHQHRPSTVTTPLYQIYLLCYPIPPSATRGQ